MFQNCKSRNKLQLVENCAAFLPVLSIPFILCCIIIRIVLLLIIEKDTIYSFYLHTFHVCCVILFILKHICTSIYKYMYKCLNEAPICSSSDLSCQ